MLNWLKSKKNNNKNQYDLDKKMQIECLICYWYKTIEKHEDRLPKEFINDSVDPKVITKFMTDVVQFGWEVNAKNMTGKGFSNNSVIQPHIGALSCAVLHYLTNFSDEDRDVYIGATWWAMCFAMLDDLKPDSTTLELTVAVNCKRKLLDSKGLELNA
jgi:hypothetical protein